MEVILATNDAVVQTKSRTVTVSRTEVNRDIDLLTHKHVDGNAEQDLRIRNAVSSDNAETVDSAVLARYVEFRDARLRRRLQFALAEVRSTFADDTISTEETFTYDFVLPLEFNDSVLRPLAEYIHRYLVWGALYDWYAQFGSRQAAVYADGLDDLERDIVNMLRSPSEGKRPMQPFGPAYKI